MYCFVMMPFHRSFNGVFGAIKKSVRAVPGDRIQCVRLDNSLRPTLLLKDLTEKILHSTVCIADLTGCNPNVMWEVGYAMGLRKDVILITQDSLSKLPFDINHFRTISYKLTDLPDSRAKRPNRLGSRVAKALCETLGRRGRAKHPSTKTYKLIMGQALAVQFSKAVEALNNPRRMFYSESEYMKHLLKKASGLGAGQELIALCGLKAWKSRAVRNYFEANMNAVVERGARIKRTFFLFDRHALEEAKLQKSRGVEVKVIHRKDAKRLEGLQRVPLKLGFVIVDGVDGKEVVVHWGTRRKLGASFDDEILIGQFRNVFDSCDAEAKPLSATTRAARKRGRKAGAKSRGRRTARR